MNINNNNGHVPNHGQRFVNGIPAISPNSQFVTPLGNREPITHDNNNHVIPESAAQPAAAAIGGSPGFS